MAKGRDMEHRTGRDVGGWGMWGMWGMCMLATAAACGDPAEPPPVADTGSTSLDTGTSTPPTTVTTGDPEVTTGVTTGPGGTSTSAAETTASPSTGDTSTTGPVACDKNVVLMGYWPPTNEMLRPWSTNPEQNPGGWIGEDWEGYGYDVYSFFPEFPPDGDPTNDDIGEAGAVGSPRYDLRVDYQATSADFWRIVDEHRPVIIVTTSRGGDIGWEIEAIEGGHGVGNDGGPASDWASDEHGAVHRPTEKTIEARSWDAISSYRQGNTLPTRHPVEAIIEATTALGLTDVVVDETGTSGNFLSGFLGLHGLYYSHVWAEQAGYEVVAAGHIHVGFGLPVESASALIEATLHAVLQTHPADAVSCP